jgi:Gpi18-like mannosyltransferase
LLVVLCLCRGWRTTHDGWLIGAWLVFALAVCAKLQSIVLLPVLFAVTIVHRKPAKALIAMAGCGLAVTALYSPFLLVHRWDYLERVFVRSFTRYGNTCVNGFNLWGLWVVRPSAERVLGLSYAHLGQLLYLGCVGWYCVWLARAVSARIGQETSRQLLLVAAYACVAPFMVLTGMHERYIAPAIVFLVMAACLDRRLWWLAVGFSVTYALNLLYVLWKSGPAPPEEWAIRDASKFALRVFSSLLNIALFGWLTVKLSALLVPGSSEQVGSSSVPSA